MWRDFFFLSLHRLWCPPQLKNRDTRHAHERFHRLVSHEWEGLRKSPFRFVEMTQVLMYLTAHMKVGNSGS